MKEIWNIIHGYSDYQISNYGRVKSLKFNKEKILKLPVTKKGYLQIRLYKNGKRKLNHSYRFYIHRLVANAFIFNPDNKPEINHKDGNKMNNYIDNLEWVIHSDNMKHAIKKGLFDNNGEKNCNSKITKNDILVIHGLYLSGISQKIIGLIYNIAQQNVSLIVNGKNWKYLL